MATKYQVFVSSTYEDLKAEREVVIKAILEMNHIPVGMEMFSAADDEQWKIIARHIEESDYYCVIVAHRYGSIAESVSFTRKEYEYAVSIGIPVLGFILDDSVSWPPDMVDKDPDAVEALADFKELVKGKPVSFWKSAEDLYGKVSIALTKQITINPRQGWVRTPEAVGAQVTNELSRLSAENSALREQIAVLQAAKAQQEDTELKDLLRGMLNRKTDLPYKYARGDKDWSYTNGLTFGYLFHLLGPQLASESSVDVVAKDLAMHVREDKDRPWWTVAVNYARELLVDWMALGITEPSRRRHAVSDVNEYWTLTPLGQSLLVYSRKIFMDTRNNIKVDEGGSSAGSRAVRKTEPAKKATAKKATAKKTTAKKTTAKKTTAKKAPAKEDEGPAGRAE